jgi:hypothetical protein
LWVDIRDAGHVSRWEKGWEGGYRAFEGRIELFVSEGRG